MPDLLSLSPADEDNAALLANVHPPQWKSPEPKSFYDLVVIGGGTAGLVSAAGTAFLGGKVALVERHLLGGDCLNYGCVPSKALLRVARAAYDAHRAADFGVEASGRPGTAAQRWSPPGNAVAPLPAADFPSIMSRMRRLRAQISGNDSAQRFTGLGVDVFLGSACFTGPQTVEVGGHTLRFKRCVIATGTRPTIPDVPGLAEVGCLTNETIFSLTELPPRLAVIGGGPIGCELAQAFGRFGSRATLIQRGPRLLPKDEPEAAEIIAQQLRREGIEVIYDATLLRVEATAAGKKLTFKIDSVEKSVEVNAVLVATGRAPNVAELGLDAARVKFADRGVAVNDFLQTTNRRIFAAGDCLGSYQFTHAADAMARICIQNAFFSLGPFGRRRLSELVVPWTTYTDPEVAHVGLTQAGAEQQGIAIDTYREELLHIDRAVLDGEEQGFAVIHCRRGTSQVVGCTIVARHAGEMIGEIALLMTARLSLATLARTIHCYPTQVEVLKRLGDQYNRRRLTPRVAAILKAIIGWRR